MLVKNVLVGHPPPLTAMIEEISAERSLLHQIRIGRMIVRYTRLPEPIPQSQDGSGLAMLTIGVHTSEVNGVVAHRIDVVGIPAITQVIEEGSLTDTWLLYKPYSQPIGLYEQKMRRKSAKKVQGGGPHHSVPANFTTSYCPPLPYPQPYRPHPYAPAPYPMPPQLLLAATALYLTLILLIITIQEVILSLLEKR